MNSPLVQAIVLGVLQGATEFLPVSSSGHLALGQMLFGVKEPSLTLGVLLHAGTLLATLLLVRQRLRGVVLEAFAALRDPRRLRETPGGRDLAFVVLASVPTGAIGLLGRDLVEHLTGSPLAVGLGFVATAGLLLSTRRAPVGTRDVTGWKGALLVGVVQGFAVLPGVSRSGSTLVAALWLGVRPQRAFELSMLISLPAVTGAVLLEARKLADFGDPTPALVGAGVALITGLVALWVLQHVVVRGHLVWFVGWLVPAALLCFYLAMAGG